MDVERGPSPEEMGIDPKKEEEKIKGKNPREKLFEGNKENRIEE